MSVTFVQRLRKVTFILLIVIPVVSALATAAISAPRPAATVSGVAIEASRDVSRTPMAPVEYSFGGETRVELIHSRAVAGEVVVFDVDAEGNPDSRSWLSFLVFVCLVGGTLGIAGVMIRMILTDVFEDMEHRAQRDTYVRSVYA